jgi:HK97 family phage portal protein
MFQSLVGTLFNQQTSTAANPAAWLLQSLGLSGKSSSGINVSINSVLGIPEVWMAVSKISGHLAQMPIDCHKYEGDDRAYTERVYNDAGARILADPSEFFTHSTVIEKWAIDALLYGNGRLYIERAANGQPIGLYPLQAENCTTVVADGQRWHTVTIDSASAVASLERKENQESTMYKIPDRDILYLIGLSRNGWWGENPIEVLKDTFGLSIAGREASGSTFRNAGRPGLLLEAPRGAFRTAKEASEFLDQFNQAHEGLDKSGKTGMIREGMKAQVLPNDGNTGGYVQQRQFQRESAAMIFLLESIFGDNTGSTYKSVTERNAAYITNCLGRWINKIQDECDKKLLSGRQKAAGNYCYKMDTSALYKHDRISLAQYTSNLRQQLMISGNEVRELHGLRPMEGLDDDFNPHMKDQSQEAPEEIEEYETVPEPDDGTEIEAKLEENFMNGKYDHIDFTPPEGVRKAAARGLEMREEHGRGGTAVGVARARDLKNGKKVSPSTAKRMKSYFARHEVDTKAEGFNQGEEGYPSAGRVAWQLWGSFEGRAFANKLVKQMEAADKK